ncbi:unnamed protein product [Camellia sinensis]
MEILWLVSSVTFSFMNFILPPILTKLTKCIHSLLNMQEKLRQTRELYASFNAMLEIKDLMLKKTSLLNSINPPICTLSSSLFLVLLVTILIVYPSPT